MHSFQPLKNSKFKLVDQTMKAKNRKQIIDRLNTNSLKQIGKIRNSTQ